MRIVASGKELSIVATRSERMLHQGHWLMVGTGNLAVESPAVVDDLVGRFSSWLHPIAGRYDHLGSEGQTSPSYTMIQLVILMFAREGPCQNPTMAATSQHSWFGAGPSGAMAVGDGCVVCLKAVTAPSTTRSASSLNQNFFFL